MVRENNNKLRVVYDASAKLSKDAYSLNDCLHLDPLFLLNLTGILLRFRLYPVVVLSDIEKAFLQISLKKVQDLARFLCIEKPISNRF